MPVSCEGLGGLAVARAKRRREGDVMSKTMGVGWFTGRWSVWPGLSSLSYLMAGLLLLFHYKKRDVGLNYETPWRFGRRSAPTLRQRREQNAMFPSKTRCTPTSDNSGEKKILGRVSHAQTEIPKLFKSVSSGCTSMRRGAAN